MAKYKINANINENKDKIIHINSHFIIILIHLQ